MKFLTRFLCAFVLLFSIIEVVVPITSHAQSIKVSKSFKSAAKKASFLVIKAMSVCLIKN